MYFLSKVISCVLLRILLTAWMHGSRARLLHVSRLLPTSDEPFALDVMRRFVAAPSRVLRRTHNPQLNYSWPLKRVAQIEGDIVLGGLVMVHERDDSHICGRIMTQGGKLDSKAASDFAFYHRDFQNMLSLPYACHWSMAASETLNRLLENELRR